MNSENKKLNVKKYIFDLDLPEEKRWLPILNDFKDKFDDLNSKITALLNVFGYNSFFAFLIRSAIHRNASSIMYLGEMKCISEQTGMALEKIFIMQLCYEACASCTTLITRTYTEEEKKWEHAFFFRSMDWDMIWLQEFTVQLVYIRRGKQIFEAPTWVGCVGLFTAWNSNLALAINFRQVQPPSVVTFLGTISRLYQMYWPASYLLRACFEKEWTQQTIKNTLCEAALVAPCYFTLFDPQHISNSMIITRGIKDFHVQHFDEKQNFLVQTNCDWDKETPNILWSVERRTLLKKWMQFPWKEEKLIIFTSISNH